MHEERTIAVDGLVILVLENHLAADPAGGRVEFCPIGAMRM